MNCLLIAIVLLFFYFLGKFPFVTKQYIGGIGAGTRFFVAIFSMPLFILLGNYLSVYVTSKNLKIEFKNTCGYLVSIFTIIYIIEGCILLYCLWVNPGCAPLIKEFSFKAILYLFWFYPINFILLLFFHKKEVTKKVIITACLVFCFIIVYFHGIFRGKELCRNNLWAPLNHLIDYFGDLNEKRDFERISKVINELDSNWSFRAYYDGQDTTFRYAIDEVINEKEMDDDIINE